MRARVWLIAVLVAVVVSGCQALRERSAKRESIERLDPAERARVSDIVRRGVERCVTIRPGFLTVGSGCIVTSDGWILTAEHVVRGRGSVEVELPDGTTREGRVIAVSAGNDFALVKIDARDLSYFRLGHRPSIGARVIAIGTPTKWVRPNASTGEVIYPQVRIPGEHGTYYYDAIFHSSPIFPGDSGGPLVDAQGDLVGLHGGFASESASVAPAAVEIMRLLPGGGRRKLELDLFRRPDGNLPDLPIVWSPRAPKDFAESSEWTIRSVEDTLIEVYRQPPPPARPVDRAIVHSVLRTTRDRFVARRAADARGDDELVRAMLADVFRQLEERARAAASAVEPPRPAAPRPRRRRRRAPVRRARPAERRRAA